MPNGIHALDENSKGKLRSSQILVSLPQIVSELVQNSLDAGATRVDVGVDYEEWSCWVRDDGMGITKGGLEALGAGSGGGRYSTSKAYNLPSLENVTTFGFRGEALASAADVCCLEVSSRTARSKESWSIITKGGESLYYGPAVRWRREKPGTVVSVKDAFYNLPIRRLSHPNASKTVELIQKSLETHALVFPHVAFSLEDSGKLRRAGTSTGHIMTIPKTQSTLSAFRHLYGRALVEHVEDISEEFGPLRLEGFISLDGASSKAHQLLYVNKHVVDSCGFHRAIDLKFASSTFAKHGFDETGRTASPRPAARRSPRKQEHKPVYVLNLTVPQTQLDNCLEPAKSALHFQNGDLITSFLSKVVTSVLVKHGFLSENRKRPSQPTTPTPKSRHRGKNINEDDEDLGPLSSPHFRGWNGSSLQANKGKDVFLPDDDGADEELTWTDPVSGQTYMIDPRTGNSYIRGDGQAENTDEADRLENLRNKKRHIVDTRRLTRSVGSLVRSGSNGDAESSDAPQWIRDALKGNSVFAVTEKCIPSATKKPKVQRRHRHRHRHQEEEDEDAYDNHTAIWIGDGLDSLPSSAARDVRALQKQDLQRGEVICQVDRKFIALFVEARPDAADEVEGDDNASTRTLLLIDQHAADERVRVEQLLKAICSEYLDVANGRSGVRTKLLDSPKPVLLTRSEASKLRGSEEILRSFSNWGFGIQSSPEKGKKRQDNAEADYEQVHFSTVPAVVSEKLLAGDSLREVVKSYLARLVDEGPPNVSKIPDSEGEFRWLKALRFCPQGLIDLINSKACRGAIMFNDPLTIDQCERLVQQLSMTVFPFQCAHGRPTTIPLAYFPGSSSAQTTKRGRDVNWERFLES